MPIIDSRCVVTVGVVRPDHWIFVVTGQSVLVDHVVRVSKNNVTLVEDLVSKLAKSLEEIVAVNKKNVFETNVVIEKLPAMLVEAQKHGLIKNKI